jgi:hypothetical protein
MKGISGWKGSLFSYGVRLALLKSCLASIHIYLISIIKFPKWAIEAINYNMTKFFWDDSEDKHRFHQSNIQSFVSRKSMGHGYT